MTSNLAAERPMAAHNAPMHNAPPVQNAPARPAPSNMPRRDPEMAPITGAGDDARADRQPTGQAAGNTGAAVTGPSSRVHNPGRDRSQVHIRGPRPLGRWRTADSGWRPQRVCE